MNCLKTFDKEVTLPDYMNALTQDVLEVLSKFPDAKDRIIAAGVSDNQLYMINCLLDIRIITPNGKMIPVESYPSYDGNFVFVRFEQEKEFKVISSRFALKVGEDVLSRSELYVNDRYVCDLSTKEAQTSGSRNEKSSKEIHK